MRKNKIIATSALALMGAGLLGACELPGGEPPELPDVPDQICEFLPIEIAQQLGCDVPS